MQTHLMPHGMASIRISALVIPWAIISVANHNFTAMVKKYSITP